LYVAILVVSERQRMALQIKERDITGVALAALFLGWAASLGYAQQTDAGVSSPVAPDAAAAESGKALRILYVGHPGSERERDFLKFLSSHFGTVKTGDLKTFTEGDAADFDVTLLDYDGDGFKAPRPVLSRNFSRPVVTIGVVGGLICDSLRLKTGYL
jgi:hypothetical protein